MVADNPGITLQAATLEQAKAHTLDLKIRCDSTQDRLPDPGQMGFELERVSSGESVSDSVSETNPSHGFHGTANPDSLAASRRMRSFLCNNGVRDSHVQGLTDEYLHLVMNRTKDGKRRTFEYSAEKLLQAMRWREEYGARNVVYGDVSRSLAPGHMWWEGNDRFGRPILYVRPARMDLTTYDTQEYLKAHVYLIEEGLRQMPKGVATFVLVVDATGLGRKHVDLRLMKGLLKVATVAYPDRLGAIVVGPVNMLVRTIWNVLSKLMPKSLADKIKLTKSPRTILQNLLSKADTAPNWLP